MPLIEHPQVSSDLPSDAPLDDLPPIVRGMAFGIPLGLAIWMIFTLLAWAAKTFVENWF